MGGTRDELRAWPWFRALWALSACFHSLGNARAGEPIGHLAICLAAGAVLALPTRRWPLVALAVTTWVTIWLEAPLVGNHWLLSGMVGLAVLVGLAGARDGAPGRVLPAVRAIVLVFYAFAAFAKLNVDFFDPVTSCATFFLRESADSFGLPNPVRNATVGWAVVLGIAAIELSIPVLLLRRSTRTIGVLLALTFHAVVAVGHSHQFFDFSSLLAAAWMTFLPHDVLDRLAERVRRLRFPAALFAVVAGGVAASDSEMAFDLGWLAWQPLAAVSVLAAVLALRRQWQGTEVTLRPPLGPALVVGLVVLNGVLPYLEVKTSAGWNMYANLRTAGGDSNHLLITRTLPLTGPQDDLVTVIATDDGVLAGYIAAGYALPVRQLRGYLQKHPDVSAELLVGDEPLLVTSGVAVPARLGPPVPEWVRRLFPLRAVDLGAEVRCQDTFIGST